MACVTKDGEYIPVTKRVERNRSWKHLDGASENTALLNPDGERKKRHSRKTTPSSSSSSSSSESSSDCRRKRRRRKKSRTKQYADCGNSSKRSSSKHKRKRVKSTKRKKRRRGSDYSISEEFLKSSTRRLKETDCSSEDRNGRSRLRGKDLKKRPKHAYKNHCKRTTRETDKYRKNCKNHQSLSLDSSVSSSRSSSESSGKKRKRRKKKKRSKKSRHSHKEGLEYQSSKIELDSHDEGTEKESFPELNAGYENRRTTNYLKLGYGKEEDTFGLPDVECVRCGKAGHFFKFCPTLCN